MENDLSGQLFLTLLRQVVKKIFYGEQDALNNEKKSRIFADSKMPKQKISECIVSCDRLLRKAARGNWAQNRMEQEVAQFDISEEHQKVFCHIWKTESSKIHKLIVSKTIWNNELNDFAWRIDVKANAKNTTDINEPTAIIRLNLKNRQHGGSDVLHCEMDKDGLASVVAELDKIQEQIDNVSSQ
eukprot:CAMPEP_0184496248 /NCGR_PEP_ID=MMETSP0113_2-20130426/33451_1 /TAXON_ID=91329 /ORGANISM="Norrisiella sphaerica, Strain BC52" /LENGTH=184 /DNA_ID=CAMNT_0026882793 /DNA_START=36 /DNA_END=590 /DNA_ORIENTATION=+